MLNLIHRILNLKGGGGTSIRIPAYLFLTPIQPIGRKISPTLCTLQLPQSHRSRDMFCLVLRLSPQADVDQNLEGG